MGLILDTGILIASERRGESIGNVLRLARHSHGEVDVAICAVTVVELTHGIYRAKTEAQRERRRVFTEGAFQDLIVHPLSLEIAQLAGKIEGEKAAQGISIAIEDLLIGAAALHLGFDVATSNVQHFKLIPGLKIVTLQAHDQLLKKFFAKKITFAGRSARRRMKYGYHSVPKGR